MRVVSYTGILLMLVLLAACGGTPEAEPEGAVTVQEFRYVRLPGGARIVSGMLLNPTSKPIHNAQIRIGLYDEYNRLISAMSVMVQDVQPGARKSFREAVDARQDVRGAKVQHILVL